jgi:hypothetical protein
MIFTLSTSLHRSTQKHLRWHSITKILRNGPRAHFPFTRRADQPGPEAETQVRGKRERRLDLDRRAAIRSALVKSKLPDLGRTPEI